jgi:F-type H+-transporting ATPase subunit b
VAAAEEEQGAEEHVCPGHGPDDPPPRVNYWHGMLMIDNERAQKPDFLDQLLFRYEDEKNPCDPKNEPPPYMAALLNFTVLVYVLYRFGRKPLTDALLKRKQSIMAEIDLADELYEKAEARLDDYEERLENIEGKLAEVRAEYAAQADVEQKHLLAEAEERRVRMRRDAEFRIEQERKAVRDALLAEAVLSASVAAEALIQKHISRTDQERMATDYLTSVGAAFHREQSSTSTLGAQT